MRNILAILLALGFVSLFGWWAAQGVPPPPAAPPPPMGPHPYAITMPSAKGYWIEYGDREGGWICHASAGRWPIPEYQGEGAKLWVVRLEGLGKRFLIFDGCWGREGRRIVFEVLADDFLVPAADGWTFAEIQGDEEWRVIESTFDDVDHDGMEEFILQNRESVHADDTLIAHWAVRTSVFGWDGTKFVPRYLSLAAGDDSSPNIGGHCMDAVRAADLDGNGCDELLFRAGAAGTGLHYTGEHVLTARGGAVRKIFSETVRGYDINPCAIDSCESHNEEVESEVEYHAPSSDGVARITVRGSRTCLCECSSETLTRKQAVPPPEVWEKHYVWRPGTEVFKPVE